MNKKWFFVIGMVLVLSLGVVGVTMAQGPDAPQGQPSGQRAPHPKANMLEPVAELLGMSVDDLTAELKGGKKLEDVVTEHGKTMADVANVVYDAAVQALNDAVTNGKITQEQADTIQARLQERRDACVNDGNCQLRPPARSLRNRVNPRAMFNQVMETGLNLADALNLDPRDMLQAFRDGTSLQDLATQQGVSMDDIALTITAPLKERLDQALQDGKITQDQYDKAMERLQTYQDKCASDGKCMPNFGNRHRTSKQHSGGFNRGNGNSSFQPGAPFNDAQPQ